MQRVRRPTAPGCARSSTRIASLRRCADRRGPAASLALPRRPLRAHPMTIDTDLTDRTDVTVLVAHVSFAVGAAVAQRLSGYGAVTLVHANTLLFGRDEHPCDLLLLCPYMTPVERDGIIERM